MSGPRRQRWLRALLAAAAAGVLAVIIVVNRGTLARSVTALARLHWSWFLLALAFESLSLLAFGLSRRRLLRAEGHQADLGSVMAITYAGNALSIAVPFAGSQLAVIFSYRQFRRRGLNPAITSWALGVSAIASSSALALVLIVGALASGAPAASAAGFTGAALFLVPGVTVLLALRYRWARDAANRALGRLIRLARRVIPRLTVDPASLEEFLDRLASIRLPWPRYVEVFGLAVVNWVADGACLAAAIRATGGPVPWQGLTLAYGAGAAAGSTGLTPGGFALVEVTLTAALVAAGMGASRALTAVLAYRLINFWLILVGGAIAMMVLTHARDHKVRRYSLPGPAPDALAEAGADRPGGGAGTRPEGGAAGGLPPR